MKKAIIILLLTVACYTLSEAQQKYTISGFVEDVKTGERLIGASVYDAISLQGTTTNNYGYFSLRLSAGKVKITVSYVGYKSYQQEVDLTKDITLKVTIDPTITLDEVTIEEKKSGKDNTQMSLIEIPVQKIKSLPVLFGEIDIIKTLQLLPGVQSGGEGGSGLYVRGGGPDQNLILLDGVPVYNADHLFGFFSVFNADAVKNVTLIKGGFPARYGGRLSSVLDIYMKEGNTQKIKGEGSIGLISSKLTVEGPIFKDKTSFIISGRRTYIDILAQPFIALANQDPNQTISAGYYFYDVNAKINHKFSDKNRIYLSAYLGKDKFYINGEQKYDVDTTHYEDKMKMELGWGNLTTAFRWNYIINSKLFVNTTLTYSQFKLLVFNEFAVKQTFPTAPSTNLVQSLTYSSGINDQAAKIDFDYIPSPNHYVKFGFNDTYHTFNPGLSTYKSSAAIEASFGNPKIYGNEIDAYLEDDIKIGALLKTNIGLHYSGFSVKKQYYQALQPRLSLCYLLSEKLSLKAAFAQMNQYILLLTPAKIGLPTDLWLPVTDKIKPQKSYQVAAGGIYNLAGKIDISLEGFYKSMYNLIEYEEGSDPFSFGGDWENKVDIGRGWSYGAEVLIQKNVGKTSGWIGYTLSWSQRQFDSLNFGKAFPYRYDRRHDISIALTHRIKENIEISLVWVYGTGNAVTLAIEKYVSNFSLEQNGNAYDPYRGGETYYDDVEYFDGRNGYRMPSYHRLDIGVNFKKKKKWGERMWSVGIYNVYNRKNPFFLQFENDANGNVQLVQYSLFPIIPSISYSFKF